MQDKIEQLAVPHRAKEAYYALLEQGFAVLPTVLSGLQHESEDVRYYCARLLDHIFVPEALVYLVPLLEDKSPKVRIMALHALACDKCKQGVCLPNTEDYFPTALQALKTDTDAHVRAMAVEVVGKFVYSNQTAVHALKEAQASDVSPTVRKKAGWYVPGGSIYQRRLPSSQRKRKTA